MTIELPAIPHWEGVKGAADHRTVGSHRAWCLREGEWCYPDSLCRCCLERSEDYVICPNCEGEGFVKK